MQRTYLSGTTAVVGDRTEVEAADGLVMASASGGGVSSVSMGCKTDQ